MSVLPVIERELRASARQPATHWVRVLGVLMFLLALILVVGMADATGPDMGRTLFGALHGTVLCAIWVLVPLLTADCISKERREGTLPLLFLTPLRARDIVLAKGFAHGLRALTLWLAVLPILAVPLLAGGVGAPEILTSALVNLASLCLATAAGILASAISRVWTRAMAAAVCLACSFAMILLATLPAVVNTFGRFFPARWWWDDSRVVIGLMYAANARGIWHEWATRFRGSPWSMLYGYLVVALGAALVLLLVILIAARCVGRVWREGPPSARAQWLERKLTHPVFFQPLLKRWLRWQLGRNPIGWLEQRNWSSRLVVWSWLAVVACFYSTLLVDFNIWRQAFHGVQRFMAVLLMGSMAVSAAGSFRRERETGVLELLLVAPLKEMQVISGRVRGIWAQFSPAIVLLCTVWLYCGTFLPYYGSGSEVLTVCYFCVAFATLPVVGLYFSLAKTNFMAALLWTLLTGVAVPAFIGQIIAGWVGAEEASAVPNVVAAALQTLIAGLLAARLLHCLRRRKFAFQSRAA